MQVWDAVFRILIRDNGIRHVAKLGMNGRMIFNIILKEVGCGVVDWIDALMGRIWWCAVLCKEMNLQIL